MVQYFLCCVQTVCASLSSQDIKDVETSVAGARIEKVKAEQAEAAVRVICRIPGFFACNNRKLQVKLEYCLQCM